MTNTQQNPPKAQAARFSGQLLARFIWPAFFGYCCVVALLTWWPGDQLPQAPFSASDKLLHVILFVPLGVLGSVLIQRLPGFYSRLAIWLFMPLFAVLSELLQCWIPGRVWDLLDLVANMAGVLLGLVVAGLFKVGQKSQKRKYH